MSNWGTKGADLKSDTRVRLSYGPRSRDCVCVHLEVSLVCEHVFNFEETVQEPGVYTRTLERETHICTVMFIVR